MLVSNVSVNGNTGTDTLTFGALSASTVQGGQDQDTITINGASTSYVNGNKGNDRIVLNNTTGAGNVNSQYGSSTIRGGQGGDAIQIGSAAATMVFQNDVYGDKGSDSFTAGAVITLAGSTVTGVLYGGEDSDTFNMVTSTTVGFAMDGGEGNDAIAGADSIVDGDTMTGGAGNDTFTVREDGSGITYTNSTTFTYDTITDFTNGADVIAYQNTGGAATAVVNYGATDESARATFAAAGTAAEAALVTAKGGVAAAGDTILFSWGGNSYLLIADATAGFNAGDYVAEINTSANVGVTINANGQIISMA